MHATVLARPKRRGAGIGSSRHVTRTVRPCVSHALDTVTEGCPRGHKRSILSPSRLYASNADTYTVLHALPRPHDIVIIIVRRIIAAVTRLTMRRRFACRRRRAAACSREGVKTCEKRLRDDAHVAIFHDRSSHRSAALT